MKTTAEIIRERIAFLETLVSAVQKLGPENSRAALAAFQPGTSTGGWADPKGGWADCPIALAYGEAGALCADADALEQQILDEQRRLKSGVVGMGLVEPKRVLAAAALGLSLPEVNAIIEAYDADCDTVSDSRAGAPMFVPRGRGIDRRAALLALLREQAAQVPAPAPETIRPEELTVVQTISTKVLDKNGNNVIDQTAQIITAPADASPTMAKW